LYHAVNTLRLTTHAYVVPEAWGNKQYWQTCGVVKCSEVLQCSDGPSNKVSNIIRRHTDNSKLQLICILLLSHSLGSIFYQCIYGSIPL
jgi:hypothetical protein